MRVSRYQFISFTATLLIFVAVFSYVLGVPSKLYDPEMFPIFESKSEKKSSVKKPSVKSASAKVIDVLDGVNIYYNGNVSSINGRNLTKDGYNLGLKYQCVEFVKRYYYEHYHHKMPNSYGNAKDFYNNQLQDGEYNKERGLVQYNNASFSSPKKGDLLVFGPTSYNRFGHVAILSQVKNGKIEFAQQNPGPKNPSREWRSLSVKEGMYHISDPHIIGWLRKQ